MVRTSTVDVISGQIQRCKIVNPTEEELVEYLISSFPVLYSRTKRKLLVTMVRKARFNNNKRMRKEKGESVDGDEDEEVDVETSNSKKRKKTKEHEREKRLVGIEEEHRKRFNFSDSSEVSTSEDAVYGEKIEVKMDVMKDALRDKYVKMAKVEEKNIEVEMVGKRGKKGLEKRKVTEETEVRAGGPKFKDIGGIEKILEELIVGVLAPLFHPQLWKHLGVQPKAGILLHGPPGCGKTMLANAMANEAGVPFYKISASEVVSGVSGASEENIRELFSKATRTAPSIVFIDEIDAIALKREGTHRDMSRRIVSQLMTCIAESRQMLHVASSDLTSESSDQASGHVLVIGATNHIDEIDPALRRPGRFDSEIYLGVPDEKARVHILSVLTRNLKLEGDFDLLKIARLTPGYVGADLASLASEAGNLALRRIMYERKNKLVSKTPEHGVDIEWCKPSWSPSEFENLSITMNDFEEAVKKVQPSLKREGFSTIPDVTWEDVGGLDDVREVLTSYIVNPILTPEKYEKFKMDSEIGFLLYGPPGCGKTILAKAVANAAGANFIHIKGPEILNKYVGESEMAVRSIFNRARACTPCIIFFDEVDALTAMRGSDGGRVADNVVAQLLTELDGGNKRTGVYVIGATNRLEAIDKALLRPGRFGKHLYVGYPSPDQRAQILKAICRMRPIDPDVDLDVLARSASCENFSGAHLEALVIEATVAVIEELKTLEQSGDTEASANISTIRMQHFEKALAADSKSIKHSNSTDLNENGIKKMVEKKFKEFRGIIPSSVSE